MPLLNYTTTVDAEKTIGEIQRLLAKAGARQIMTEYDDAGLVTSLSFSMVVNGQVVGFRLPTDWRPILSVLEKQRVEPRYKTQQQALKTAWRITKDWVEAQLAIIETKMVAPEQAFLPYAVMQDKRTLYENMADRKFLLEPPR